MREGVGKGYYAYRAAKADPTESRLGIRVEVAALFRINGVVASVEAAATAFAQEHLSKFAVEIKNTTGATRDAYRKVQEQTAAPEAVTIELRANEKAATKSGAGDDLPTFSGHIYSDPDGMFPADLNDWEREVVKREVSRPSFVAWYRNPSRAMPNALRSPIWMTLARGSASRSTSSSSLAVTMGRWRRRSSIPTEITWRTPRASFVRSLPSLRLTVTPLSGSSRSPRVVMAHCGRSTSLNPRCAGLCVFSAEPRYRRSMTRAHQLRISEPHTRAGLASRRAQPSARLADRDDITPPPLAADSIGHRKSLASGDILDAPDQLTRVDGQRLGQPGRRVEARVSLAAFQRPDAGAGDAGLVSERLLGDALPLAFGPDPIPNSR